MMESLIGKLLGRADIRLVAELAHKLGIDVFLVGGCVRDLLLERESNDLDFALSGYAEELPSRFASKISGSFFWLDEKRKQGRVVNKGGARKCIYDFAPLIGASIEEDLYNRDFTINSLALSLGSGKLGLIDPLNGSDDLRRGLIRMCNSESFDSDPLRLMRAIRFAAELAFTIEEETWRALYAKASQLSLVAAERVRDEIFRTLAAPGCGSSLKKFWESGLWTTILTLPSEESVESGTACAQAAEQLCSETVRLHALMKEQLAGYLDREIEGMIPMLSIIKLAAFLGHADKATITSFTETLRLGKDTGRILTLLCRDERPVYQALEGNFSIRPLFRFFRDREPAGPALLIVAKACGEIPEGLYNRLMGCFLNEYDPDENDLFLSGREVMDILAIPPGKAVGIAMEKLRAAESNGVVNSKEEAQEFVKNLLTNEEAMG